MRIFTIVAAFSGMVTSSSSARPYLLLEAATGKIISHNQAFDRWHPASLTKMMTAYVVFSAIKAGEITLKSPVRISSYALSKPPSKMGLPVGTILNMDNALKILLVKSANDIAVAIAESVSGSEAAFAGRMTATARKIGMTGSNFVNPHGLHSPRQYTTARDMAVLALALSREFPQYSKYFRTARLKHGKKILRSYNRLLERFQGADGFKTGYVCASGYNIVAAATRNRRRLIAVVLGEKSSRERNIKAAKLLSEGFRKSARGGRLKALRPYGSSRYVATNLKVEICDSRRKKYAKKETKKQRRARWKKEDAALRVREARYMGPLKPSQPVRIVLGNATGPSPVSIKVVNGSKPPPYVPVPTPRPAFKLARIDDLPPVHNTLRGSVAVPSLRPSETGR